MSKFRMKHLSKVPHEISCTLVAHQKTSRSTGLCVSKNQCKLEVTHPGLIQLNLISKMMSKSTTAPASCTRKCFSGYTKTKSQIKKAWKRLFQIDMLPILFHPLRTDLCLCASCAASAAATAGFWNLTLTEDVAVDYWGV